MDIQQKMFTEIEAWRSSVMTKQDFLKDKGYSLAKFNYWIARQDASAPTKA